MEHGLYLKLEKITNKLAYEKGCIVPPEKYTKEDYPGVESYEIPFGKDKGKLIHYDSLRAMDFEDFIKRCFAILPRDIDDDKVITMNSLLSDKPCCEDEKTRQKVIIDRFFRIASTAGVGGTFRYFTNNPSFDLNQRIPTTYKKI